MVLREHGHLSLLFFDCPFYDLIVVNFMIGDIGAFDHLGSSNGETACQLGDELEQTWRNEFSFTIWGLSLGEVLCILRGVCLVVWFQTTSGGDL